MTFNAHTEKLTVGKEMVCWCTRCKLDLGHTIVAMIGGRPARVICRTCRSEHNYYEKKAAGTAGAVRRTGTSSGASPRPKESKPEGVPIEHEWLKQMNASTQPLKSYGADQSFSPGDRVKHPTFGDGIVQKTVFPNKIEILFRADLKTLIHTPASPKK